MKIKEIFFKNKTHPWELKRTSFTDLTLLVGVSGVGKTQILNNIMKLVNIRRWMGLVFYRG
jgi:putative ribosome biogenesis GTPase RsgA